MTDFAEKAEAMLAAIREARNLEPVYLTRGQLTEIVERLLIAEGMSIAQAKIHADLRVSQYIYSLKAIDKAEP